MSPELRAALLARELEAPDPDPPISRPDSRYFSPARKATKHTTTLTLPTDMLPLPRNLKRELTAVPEGAVLHHLDYPGVTWTFVGWHHCGQDDALVMFCEQHGRRWALVEDVRYTMPVQSGTQKSTTKVVAA
jgi:hypothetical protein